MPSTGHGRHRGHNQMELDFSSNRYSLNLRSQNRSFTPHRTYDSRRMERVDERSDFIERRDYDGSYEQKSPSYGRKAKRPLLDLEDDNTDYRIPIKYEQEPLEPRDDNFVDGESSYHKNFYRNEHDDSRLSYGNEVNYNGKRSTSSLNWKKDQKSWKGHTNMGESYQSYQDVPSTLYYGKNRSHLPTPLNADTELSEYERIPVASEKLTFLESHEDKEHLVFDSSRVTGFDYRDLRNSNEISELGRSSSKLAGNKGWGSYQARETIASSQDFPRRCDEYDPTHRVGFKVLEQRPVDSVIDSDERNYHQRGAYSPRNEREDYFYSKLRGTTNHAHEYAQGSSNKMIHLHTEMDYSLEHGEDDYRAPISMDTIAERPKDFAGSYARSNMMEGHPTLTRNYISDYRDMGRARNSIKQDGRFIDAPDDHVEVVGRVHRDYRMSHLDDSQYSHVSRMKTEHDYGREEKLKFQEENFPQELSSHPVAMYEPNHRSIDWLQTRERYDSSKQADRDSLLGNKYSHEKDIRTTSYGITISGEYHEASRKYHDLYSNDRDIIPMDSTREMKFKDEKNRNSKRTFNQRESFQSDDLLPSQECYRHKQMQAYEVLKNQTRFIKGNPRHGSLSGNSSRHFERNRHDKNHIVWERIEYCHDDVHENDYDDDQLEEMNGPADPPENSEEFMQLVLDAFLKYSKELNSKASSRRRYKWQGKGGSISCLVCGRKDFKDTRSLLRHAFMSRKAGLRAYHLGLLKAVCVMLGWNFAVPRNVVTWNAEVLPSAEALAQKEDLIIWPPIVVVRNISLLDNSPDNGRLVTTEALEALLRRKGFIRGGVKVCLGRPADQSVVVVKFIGTFSGLGDAERIHQYFEQNKRGRVEFEKITGRRRKSSNDFVVAIKEGEKVEEQVLYGYMGIAEDLEGVDLKANKASVIKSKKEIQEWANAPIKPDEERGTK